MSRTDDEVVGEPRGINNDLDFRLRAVLAEYDDCRSEITLRIQQRTQMTQYYLVGIFALIGYAIQTSNGLVWLIASAYAVFTYTLILGTYFYSAWLSSYIREEIELKKIPYILGEMPDITSVYGDKKYNWETRWLGWETNYEKIVRKRNILRRKDILRYFTLGVVCISSFCFLNSLILQQLDIWVSIGLAFGVMIFFGSISELVYRELKNNTPDPSKVDHN